MATSSNLVITNTGLSAVSRELINKRIYDPSKIIVTGHPLITTEGILSALNEESFAGYSEISFKEDTSVKITFEGIFRDSNSKNQIFYSLINPDEVNNPFCLITNGKSIKGYIAT